MTDEIIANQDARGLLPGWGGRISAALLPCLRASRYGDRFADLELVPSSDGIGRSLRGGGAK